MVHIVIELWPGGNEARKRHLGTIEIVNDGTGTEQVGNYTVFLSRRDKPTVSWRGGRVFGFRRKVFGAYDLLWLALGACFGNLRQGQLLRSTTTQTTGGIASQTKRKRHQAAQNGTPLQEAFSLPCPRTNNDD